MTQPLKLSVFSFFLLKECTSGTVEPKQKRKLAYLMDIIKGPDCVLLDIINNKKRPAKLLFKQDKNSQCHNNPWSRLPVDILHLSWCNLNCSGCGFCQKQQFKGQDNLKELLKMIRNYLFAKYLWYIEIKLNMYSLPLLMLLPVHALAIRIIVAALIFSPCCMKLLGFLLPPSPPPKVCCLCISCGSV